MKKVHIIKQQNIRSLMSNLNKKKKKITCNNKLLEVNYKSKYEINHSSNNNNNNNNKNNKNASSLKDAPILSSTFWH